MYPRCIRETPQNTSPTPRDSMDKTHRRFYFHVPFSDREAAKVAGARWDPDNHLWYATSPAIAEVMSRRWDRVECHPITDLPGESRAFGGNELFVDLVPSSCWFTNVRSSVHPADWDRLRRYVYGRVDQRCEICGADAAQAGSLEAHERWGYDDDKHIQTLRRLIALCTDCHRVTHFGFAQVSGHVVNAMHHYMRVAGIDRDEAICRIQRAFCLWEERSRHEWALDLSLIENAGIRLLPAHRRKGKSR